MTRRISKRIVVLLLLLAFILIAPVSTLADTLYVPVVRQAKSNWCWAACAEMVGRYEESGSTRSQWDVVMHVKGTSDNVVGTAEETALGAAFVCYNVSSFVATHRAFNEADIQDTINRAGNPLVVGIVWGGIGGGHMMVVDGYDSGQVRVIDPADGSTRWMSYQTLLYYQGGYYLETVCSNY